MFDTLIHSGLMIDGTGAARKRADIGIVGDRITAIGNLNDAKSAQKIDATNQIIAPGFVDVHNHTDGWILKHSHFTAKTLQGFTTEVLAADGISYAPVNEHTVRQWFFYLQALNALQQEEYRGWYSLHEFMSSMDGRNVQNAMTHIPYANIRSMYCGWGRGDVDDFQMQQIQDEIRRGMEEGAVGLSTGLDYIVQCYSTTDELVDACSAMAESQGLYVTHIRYKKGVLRGLQEAVEIGRRAGVRVHISHLKASSAPMVEEILEFLEHARRDIDLSFDVYPYQCGSTMLNYLLPYEVWEDGPLAAIDKLKNPEIRFQFGKVFQPHQMNLENIRIAWVASNENSVHQGKTLAHYVEEMDLPAADALAELLIEERLAVLCVMDKGDESLVHPFLQHDLYMMGSDGIYHPGGLVHPRVYGSAGRLLGPCVRDWKLFSLEAAIHKLSGLPAARFGLANRSVLHLNHYADIVVFDPVRVTDQATYATPHLPTVGIEHVLVNGIQVIKAGTPIESLPTPLPGRFVRRNEICRKESS